MNTATMNAESDISMPPNERGIVKRSCLPTDAISPESSVSASMYGLAKSLERYASPKTGSVSATEPQKKPVMPRRTKMGDRHAVTRIRMSVAMLARSLRFSL